MASHVISIQISPLFFGNGRLVSPQHEEIHLTYPTDYLLLALATWHDHSD